MSESSSESSGSNGPPPMKWFHVIWSTHGSWLPGDPRGFRSRGHRIHSSGDYRKPPPPGEHAGLHRYAKRVQKKPIERLSSVARDRVLDAILVKVATIELEIAVLAVAATHAHLLVRTEHRALDGQMARLRRHSSHAVRETNPGKLWSRGIKVVIVGDQSHFNTTLSYIRKHGLSENAAVFERLHP